jgi:hypothetical protein
VESVLTIMRPLIILGRPAPSALIESSPNLSQPCLWEEVHFSV